ncbi:hypothetical protein SAMN06297129_1437 [Pseudooceanicola antarcticus]|uniref:Uncharacterized protein n=2 Tax=Pseudooceanicola antarcticus TaxID=1247613 RepID=A0A285IKA7_9RHOB|nr:hypothetical protein SAMN06297129_1437 [Pseudooceanicola antarcticus]
MKLSDTSRLLRQAVRSAPARMPGPRLAPCSAPSAAIALLLSVMSALLPLSASAQGSRQACAPREVVVNRLAEGYGETRRSIGIGSNNAMVEVFASDDSGTWTITMTSPQGITCLIASGQAFESLFEALPGDDQDA